MAKSTATGKQKKNKPSCVEFVLGKGTPRLIDARVNRDEIHIFINGPEMLYDSVRLLSSLDVSDGATFQAWKRLAAALTCTSYCGHNGKTIIPVTVESSRIGTCIRFSAGPMSMYQSLVVLRPKKKGQTMREAIDSSFDVERKSFMVVLVPQAGTGHADHDASIFDPGHGSARRGVPVKHK